MQAYSVLVYGAACICMMFMYAYCCTECLSVPICTWYDCTVQDTRGPNPISLPTNWEVCRPNGRHPLVINNSCRYIYVHRWICICFHYGYVLQFFVYVYENMRVYERLNVIPRFQRLQGASSYCMHFVIETFVQRLESADDTCSSDVV